MTELRLTEERLTLEEERILNDFYSNGEFLLPYPNDPDTLIWDNFEEVRKVLQTRNDLYVVTMVDGDDDTTWLVEGYHYVNRIGYYLLTEDPRMEDDIKCW